MSVVHNGGAPPSAEAGAELWGRLARFDAAVEAAIEPARGRPHIEATAALVSNLADYGFAWALIAAMKARRPGPRRRRAVAALAVAGVSSYLVNASVKSAVRRQRPARQVPANGDRRRVVPVRAPRSTSFPSGHTLAASCTALLLAEGPAEVVGFLAFALAVGLSRVHLGDHHPSDVVGGAVVGALLGMACRPLLPHR